MEATVIPDRRPPIASIVTPETLRRIRGIDHLARSGYRDLDIARTLEFFEKRYVTQLRKFLEIGEDTVVADIGAGFGWLAMAIALRTGARVIAVDEDRQRLDAAAEISAILGISERIDWRVGSLGRLPLGDREADAAFCIEVLEHTRRSAVAVRDLARVSGRCLVITTPNLWFPVIAHDTRLPFCHWLPLGARPLYARLLRRSSEENDNLFWSALSLNRQLGEFCVRSRFLHYKSLDDFVETFPLYLPYRGGFEVARVGSGKLAFYRLAALLGRHSQYVMPNLAAVYERRSFQNDRAPRPGSEAGRRAEQP